MKRSVLLLLVLLLPFFLRAEKISEIDSLNKQLEKATSLKKKIDIYISLSKAYWYNSPSKVIEYGKKSLELAIENENDTQIVNSRINIGIGYYGFADYAEAMNQYMQSLTLSEKINYKLGISNSLSNIAIIFDCVGNIPKAKEYYLRVLKINKEIKFDKGIIVALNNLGVLYTKSKEYDKALDCYEQALTKEKAIGEKEMIAVTLSNIGDVYDNNGQKEKALEYYQNGLKAGEEMKSNMLIISSLINIGRMNYNNKNYTVALEYYEKGLKLSEDNGFKNYVKDISKYISELYEGLNNIPEALKYYKRYSELKDTLLNKEGSSKITELQIKYETEAKQKENELLLKDNKNQKNLRNFFILVSFLVLILAFVTFRSYRNKRKTNILLLEKNEIIVRQKDQLAISMAKLLQSEELYRSLVTTSPDGITITDMKANITYASPALLEIYGYNDQNNVLGKNALSFICKEERPKAINYFQNISVGKVSDVLELKGVKSDNTAIDIEISGGVLRDNNGSVYSLFFMFRDITHRKQIEQENRKQQEMIFEQQQEISKLELLKKEQENINLKSDLEFKDKELTSKAMYIIQDNERIDSVINKLKTLEEKADKQEKFSQNEIRSLINELRTIVKKDRWKEFESHFTQVHQSFYENLLLKFPDLSANEKKLCAYLRLNLSTKEISEITNKSIHSINVARTRLRQKLGISNTNDNIATFLSKF
jgi:PAS domain S-box-containing protein